MSELWVGRERRGNSSSRVQRYVTTRSPNQASHQPLPEAWKTPPLCTHSTMQVAYEMTSNRIFSRIFIQLIIIPAYTKYHGRCSKASGFLRSKCHGIIDSSTTNFAISITGYECVPHHFVYTTSLMFYLLSTTIHQRCHPCVPRRDIHLLSSHAR